MGLSGFGDAGPRGTRWADDLELTGLVGELRICPGGADDVLQGASGPALRRADVVGRVVTTNITSDIISDISSDLTAACLAGG